MIKITFLGTGSMVPTKERNATSLLLNYKSENILIDCGENTQRQLKIADISPTKITKILITHWHGDHVLGLPGILQTLAKSQYSKTLEIYGPKDTKLFIDRLHSLFIRHDEKLKAKIIEIQKDSTFVKTKDFSLVAKHLDHTSPCLAYSFIENDKRKIDLSYTKKFGLTRHPLLGKLQKGKSITFKGKTINVDKATTLIKGKKITFVFDTAFTKKAVDIAKNSDLLICESTLSSNLEKEAKEYKHLTSKQAALIAKQSKSKKLILTHFSQRYKSSSLLEKEAKTVFPNTKAAKDFTKIEI